MPWIETSRPDYDRRCLRYASDATDAEWGLFAPLAPARMANGRLLSTVTTLRYHFYPLRNRGVLALINEA